MEGQVGRLVGARGGGSFQRPDGFVHSGQVGLGAAHRGQPGDLALDRDAVVDDVVELTEIAPHLIHPLVVGHD